MKLSLTLAASAAAVALATSSYAGLLYSWESGLDGWALNPAYTSTNSTTVGVTDGLASLEITAPMSSMWYATPLSFGLDATQRQQVFGGATSFSLDVTYLNPGYTSWYGDASVALIVQGDGVGWTELAWAAVPVGSTTHATFSISSTVANQLANGSWAEMILKFTYGNGGSTGTTANIQIDNFANDVAAAPIPEPSTYAVIGGLIALGFSVLRRRRA